MGGKNAIELELEKKYRITPVQQMLSSCTGALLTSLLGNYDFIFKGLLLIK
jgi:hypothetical protein